MSEGDVGRGDYLKPNEDLSTPMNPFPLFLDVDPIQDHEQGEGGYGSDGACEKQGIDGEPGALVDRIHALGVINEIDPLGAVVREWVERSALLDSQP